MAEPRALADHRTRIDRVVQHIEDHLDEPWDVGALARVGAYSTYHFHRVFRAMVGESVMAHVRRLRLERAAREIKQTGSKIIDVGLRAGFDSHEAFTRAFTGHFGVSPSEYRKGHGRPEGAEVPAEFARLVTFPARTAVCVRHVGPFTEVGHAWQQLFELLDGPPSEHFGLCWDDPEVTDPSRFRYDACGVGRLRSGAAAVERTHAGGTYVSAVHHGPYSALPEAYGQLTRWALDRDLVLRDEPAVEHYLVGPPHGDASAYRTAIALPVQP